MRFNRRQFAQVLAGGVGTTAASGPAQILPGGPFGPVPLPYLSNGSIQSRGTATLPDPRDSGIEHIVVVTMENRSFDHLLGWVPGADGRQAGLSFPDRNGVARKTYSLAPDYTGCGHPDPDHSYLPSRVAYDGGKMDGFLRAGSNDAYSIGYYGAKDIPFYASLATNYAVCDRYFASILGPTLPNRMFQWAAQTDRLDDSISLSNLPTIFDRLDAAGVSHQYYFSNLPVLALWGFKYFFSASPLASFFNAAFWGTLPAVSFVDPTLTIFDDGTGNDDHPHADIRNGDAFLSSIFRALAYGPKWKNTVLIINFDEWGGFYEHVAPPRVAAPNAVETDNAGGVLLGFRVPVVIASPFTRSTGGPNVSSVVFDHTSILKLIEWRWSLFPLTTRDGSGQIGNPAVAMNFLSPDARVPFLPAPGPVFAFPCFGGGIFSSSARRESSSIRGEAQARGVFQIPRSSSPWSRMAEANPYVAQWLSHPRFARAAQGSR